MTPTVSLSLHKKNNLQQTIVLTINMEMTIRVQLIKRKVFSLLDSHSKLFKRTVMEVYLKYDIDCKYNSIVCTCVPIQFRY